MPTLSVLLLALRLAEPAPPPVIAVKAGKLIDPKSGTVASGAVIVIENGKIKAVGPSVAVPAGAQVIDLSDRTVLPGLIGLHTHLVGDYVNDADPLTQLKTSAAQRAFESIGNAKATLDAGFTTVRDVGTYRAFVDVAMRDAIAKGYFPGPRMYVAGAYLTITGGGGAMSGGLAPDIGLPWDLKFGIADSVDQVRQRVRDIAQHGVDVIKVLATGAFLAHGSNPHAVEYTYEELRAAVEEAAHKGLKVATHAHSTEGIKLAVKAGVASIDHGTYIDDEGLRLMKSAEPISSPTSTMPSGSARARPPASRRTSPPSSPRATRSSARPSRRPSRWASRSPSAPMQRLPPRFERAPVCLAGQVRPDAHASDPIRDDRRRGPHRPRQQRRFARAGRWADLIAVKGDPLQDVRVLENVSFVMRAGRSTRTRADLVRNCRPQRGPVQEHRDRSRIGRGDVDQEALSVGRGVPADDDTLDAEQPHRLARFEPSAAVERDGHDVPSRSDVVELFAVPPPPRHGAAFDRHPDPLSRALPDTT